MNNPMYEQQMINPLFVLGQAYIPFQHYGNLFNVNEALYRGTIFRDLYRPYKSPYPIMY